ncbi:MAG: leucine-rich repeat domain-containing protein [Solibacillus isronensis]
MIYVSDQTDELPNEQAEPNIVEQIAQPMVLQMEDKTAYELNDYVDSEFQYVDYGDDVVLVNGFSSEDPEIPDVLYLPASVNGKEVVGVNDYAFENVPLNRVVIPNKYKFIGVQAFNNSGITDLKLPSGIKTIERYAFSNNRLTDLELDHINEELALGDYAFENNNLITISLPEIQVIPSGAFRGNIIAELDIPETVTVIKSHAFQNNQIKRLDFGKRKIDNQLRIETSAFNNNKINLRVTLDEGIHYESDAFDNGVFIGYKK